MKRTLCLWFPCWPIQRLVVERPELRKTHLVLFRRDSRKGQLVAAASPLAIQAGVQTEMPVSEVKQLLRHSGPKRESLQPSHRSHPRTQYHQLARQGDIGFRGPDRPRRKPSQRDVDSKSVESVTSESRPKTDAFYILEHDPVADRQALETLVDSLHDFSPIVGIEQSDAPESCFLDVTGLGSLFGDEQALRAGVVRFLTEAGYTTFSALADTPGMAWGLAHYHSTPSHDPPSGRAGVAALQAASPGREKQFKVSNPIAQEQSQLRQFRSLPVAALRVAPATEEIFRRLGIERVEQVLAIPRTHLASRFGDEVSTRIDQAFGKVAEPIVARHLLAEFSASQFIEFPTRDRETIGVVLDRLLEQICQQLQSKQKGALQWQVRLDCVDAPSLEFQVNLFQPTATVEHVLQLMELQLESTLKPHFRRKRLTPKGSVKRSSAKRSLSRTVTQILVQEITVSVTSCVLLVQRQRQLFDESPRLDKRGLAHLINHLSSRLGQQSIVYPLLQSGAQPEFSFRFKPLVDPARMRSRKKRQLKTRSHALARPLSLLDPPLLIAESDTLPCRFRYRNTIQCVGRQWGPERIETGWWRGPTLRRDYWRVETEKGLHFWIYRDLRNGRWFLQGEF